MRKTVCTICVLIVLVSQHVWGQETTPVITEQVKPEFAASAASVEHFSGMENVRFRAVRRDRFGKVRMLMDRPHIEGDRIYLRVRLHNRSAISYDVDFFRFYIRDRKTSRRTVTQEQEMVPVWSFSPGQRVETRSKEFFVFVMNKFTLADEKVLRAEIFEKGGGRHFRMQVNNAKLSKARQFK